MNYKMIALDMDGTLLNDTKELTSLTKEVLHTLNRQGVEIVIATGRRFWYALVPLRELGFPLQILANNGSVIRNSLTGERIYQSYLTRQLYRNLVELGREYGFSPLIHVDHYEEEWDFLIDRAPTDPMYSGYLRPMEERLRILPDLLDYGEERAMVLCYMGTLAKLSLLERQINARFPGQCNTHIITALPKVGPILEIMSDKCGKWRSLKGYAATKGIGVEEIIAIGDDNNDYEMIEKAGLGIAMKNAIPEIRAIAQRLTPGTNNEDGVGLTLREIFNLSEFGL